MNDKKSKLSLSGLERHLWEAAHIITGPIDASDYKTHIFPIQEMAKALEQHRIEVPEECHGIMSSL